MTDALDDPLTAISQNREVVGKITINRDRYGRYLLPDPETGRIRPYTRVTTFAKSISDTYALSKWGERMAIKGLTLRKDLHALAAATDIEDKSALDNVAEKAKEAAQAGSGANYGTALHLLTQSVDEGKNPVIPDFLDADVRAYSELCEEHGLTFDQDYIERVIICPMWDVAGTFDRIATLTHDMIVRFPGKEPYTLPAGTRVISDLKTGKDLSYGWNEIAIQETCYSRAYGMYNGTGYDQMGSVDAHIGLVMHVPVLKGKATLYAVDLVAGYDGAEMCMNVRQWRKMRNLHYAIGVTEVAAKMQSKSTDELFTQHRQATPSERIEEASSIGELTTVWESLKASNDATPALLALTTKRAAWLRTA